MTSSKPPAVALQHISKRYVKRRHGILGARSSQRSFTAISDISLTIPQGAAIGLYGHNGAGKTTLLKIIAGIAQPTTGIVRTTGSIVSLLDLNAGFKPDLSGEENLYLNGLLVGMSHHDVRQARDEIISYAELESYIHEPFYTYSHGMKFRLAIAIALQSKCDILLMDEVITSGDVSFQQKVLKTIRTIQKAHHITTIISSHIPAFVWGFSDTYYKLDHGKLSRVSPTRMKKRVLSLDAKWKRLFLPKKNPTP